MILDPKLAISVLEPSAAYMVTEFSGDEVAKLAIGLSQAISLKRIADALEAMVTASQTGQTGINIFQRVPK